MAIKYVKTFHFYDPPKFTQIGHFWFENMPSGNYYGVVRSQKL
jgi:hypothetical protein